MLKDDVVKNSVEDVYMQEEMELRAIFASSPDAITVTDLNGNVTECNQATLDMHGYSTKEELIGKNALELIAKKDHQRAIEDLRKTLEQGSVRNIEYTFLTKDGREFAGELSASVVEDSSGKPTGFVSVTKDIRRRKKAEELLRESEERYRELTESIGDVFFAMDKDLRYTFWNKASEKLTGISAKDAIGKSLTEVFPDVKGTRIEQAYFETVRTRQPHSFEHEYQVGGKDYVFAIDAYPTKDGLSVFVRDITERKKAEVALRTSEEKYRNLVENSKDAIAVVDFNGNVLFANKAAETLTGYTLQEGKGMNIRAITPKKLWPKGIAMLLKARTGKAIPYFEYELKRKDGTIIPVETGGQAILRDGKPVAIQIISRDITERKRADEVLRESEEKFRNLAELSPNMIFVNRKGRVVYANKKAEELMGYTREEFCSASFDFMVLIAPESRELTESNFAKHMAGRDISPVEYRLVTKDGRTLDAIMDSKLIWYEGERAILGTVTDITQRKKAEEALVESEEKYRNLFENARDIILTADLEGNITSANNAVLEYGYDKGELIGRNMLDFVPKENWQQISDGFERLANGKTSEGGVKIKTKRGQGYIVGEYRSNPIIQNNKVVGLQTIIRDVTERREMEQRLRQYSDHLEELVEERTRKLKETQEQLLKRERFAAIGELAAMIGHDMRNPLQSIKNATGCLRLELKSSQSEAIQVIFKIIDESIEYSNSIIRDLLDYSREMRLEVTETNPKLIMRKALSLIRVPENIRMLDSIEDELKIKVDADKIERVFVNIIKNAIEAMPQGGTLAITSKESNGNLEVAFADTGTGMTKDVIEKLWTPLHTTRAKGIGFGLPICKRIMDAHGGSINVKSTVGKGSTFTVTFPIKRRAEKTKEIFMNAPEPTSSTLCQ